MKQALRLAKKVKGQTYPNPLVGAVIVKNEKVISSGYHKKAGSHHAEVVALRKAKNKAQGARLYVTLEPCSIFGKTPPCVDEIIESGIREVVIAEKDPNPLNRSRGIKKLRENGIKVTLGVLAKEAHELNKDFSKFITKNMSYVTLKVAQSLDGKIATAIGDSKWISSLASRKYAHKLRAESSAILIGIKTLIKDNPRLNNRYYKQAAREPKKIIVDSRLRIPENSRILSSNLKNNLIVATTKYALRVKIKRLKDKGVDVLTVKSKNKKVDLKNLLYKLAEKDIVSILVEGGSEIITSFLKEKLADKIIIFIAPKIIGGKDAPTFFEGKGIRRLKDSLLVKDVKYKKLGSDLVVEGYI